MIIEHAASLSVAPTLVSDSLHSLPSEEAPEGSLQPDNEVDLVRLLEAIERILEVVRLYIVIVNVVIAAARK
jgi:hypothetical protein